MGVEDVLGNAAAISKVSGSASMPLRSEPKGLRPLAAVVPEITTLHYDNKI